MRFWLVLLVLSMVTSISVYSVRAEEKTATVVYVNGVLVPHYKAVISKETLANRMEDELPSIVFNKFAFDLTYNHTGCGAGLFGKVGCLDDLWEAVKMEIGSDITQFFRFLGGVDPAPEFFQDAMEQIAATFDPDSITLDDIADHINTYETHVLQGRKVIMVGHSQGNYFANEEFPMLSSEHQDSTAVVAVATPDSSVAGDARFPGDHHTTLCEDIIIDFLDDLVLGVFPLPANITNTNLPFTVCIDAIVGYTLLIPFFDELTGHFFVKSYMRGGGSSVPKIVADIIDVEGQLVQPTFGVEFIPSPFGNGRAVAFDPATGRVYYTLRGSTDIFITDASNSPATSISPGNRFGALAWDGKRGLLWGGAQGVAERGNVYQVTPAGVKTLQFNFIPPGGNCYGQIPGFLDGLAYDEGPTLSDSDDSLWLSDDGGFELHHVDLSGNLIASFIVPTNPRSGRPGCNTGIAVDGDFLWLALQSGPDQAPHDIVKVAKSDPTTVLSTFAFSNTNIPGPEDLELDLVTVPDTAALWSNSFGTPNVLKLWKLRSTGMM